MHVIKLQVRGAPHVHLLIWIKNFDETPSNINNGISTETPQHGAPGSKDSKLRDLVMKHMIHGPYGNRYINNLFCLKKSQSGQCGRGFPKSNKAVKSVGVSFPNYQRRSRVECENTGTKHIGGMEILVTNKWVVAYNAYLH